MNVQDTITPNENESLVEEQNKVKFTSIQIDSTMLSIFMACPRKFEYTMLRHLVPVAGMSDSIRRGLYVHDAALAYWKFRIESGDNYQEATKQGLTVLKEKLNKDDKFDADYKLDTLQGFLEYLKFIQASSWIPLAAEKHFRVKAYEDPSINLRIYLTGRIDLILRTPQIPVLPIDAKTESERWFHTQMSNQFKIYCLATNTNLLGVQRIGFQKKMEAKDKFKMELMPFDADVLEEFRTITLPYYVKQLLIAHEEGFFPMNTTNCVHGHFKCQFSDAYNGGICNVSRQVREQKLERYFVVGEEWNPEDGSA